MKKGEIQVSGGLPFLKNGSVLYVGSAGETDEFVRSSYQSISLILSNRFKHFVYVPAMLEELSSKVVSYLFPGIGLPDEQSLYAAIRRDILNGITEPGFLRKERGRMFFFPISGKLEDCLTAYLEREAPEDDADVLYRDAGKAPGMMCCRKKVNSSRKKKEFPRSLDALCCSMLVDDEDECPGHHAPELEEPLDSKTLAILEEISRIQEKFGVTIDELDVIMGYQVKLSRMRITRDNRIFLTDFEDKEIKMDHLSKALYFLYLKHPEGIRFKELPSHRDELMDIYLGITGKGDMEEIARSIDNITDPFGNSVNVKVSRVKNSFKNEVSDRVARFYYISGSSGDVKGIPLDRDYVIWEN